MNQNYYRFELQRDVESEQCYRVTELCKQRSSSELEQMVFFLRISTILFDIDKFSREELSSETRWSCGGLYGDEKVNDGDRR